MVWIPVTSRRPSGVLPSHVGSPPAAIDDRTDGALCWYAANTLTHGAVAMMHGPLTNDVGVVSNLYALPSAVYGSIRTVYGKSSAMYGLFRKRPRGVPCPCVALQPPRGRSCETCARLRATDGLDI